MSTKHLARYLALLLEEYSSANSQLPSVKTIRSGSCSVIESQLMIPRVNHLDALIIKDIFGPSFLNNCLNRAATGSDKESSISIVPYIKPKYFDGWVS